MLVFTYIKHLDTDHIYTADCGWLLCDCLYKHVQSTERLGKFWYWARVRKKTLTKKYYSETSNRYHMFSLQQSIQWTKSCKQSPASSRESFLLSFLTVSVVSR